MQEAFGAKTYLTEIKRLNQVSEECAPTKNIGKSYDVYESKRLKNGHVGKSYDVDEKQATYEFYPTILLNNKALSIFSAAFPFCQNQKGEYDYSLGSAECSPTQPPASGEFRRVTARGRQVCYRASSRQGTKEPPLRLTPVTMETFPERI